MTDKVQKIREEVVRLKLCTMDEHMKFYSESAEAEYNALYKIEEFIDSLQEEPVSEDFDSWYEKEWVPFGHSSYTTKDKLEESFKAGAEWGKKHLWKDAQGDDLPEYEREVIVLCENGYAAFGYSPYVAFGHRPNPDGWDGRNICTNEVTHYTPKLYDKGGWNQPNVKWWLDIEKLPNMEE